MADREVYILGAGGHARVIASLLDTPVTFVVRESDPEGEAPQSGQVTEAWYFGHIEETGRHEVFLGVADNTVRRRLFERLGKLDVRPGTCVASQAFVARDAQIGEGALICPGCVIGAGAVVGDNTIVNTLSSIDHDCVLGDHSQLTAGVTFGGGVRVGTGCFFGIGSAVLPGLNIGDDVAVMAGALVTRSLPDLVTAGGNPARIMQRRAPVSSGDSDL